MVNQYIQRGLERSIHRLTAKFPIVTILGPRQSGKTTLLRHLYPDYEYISLESPDVRLTIQSDPRGFLDSRRKKPMIIDEFQRIPELVSYLQEFCDLFYHPGQVLLTGSQQYQIGEKVSQSLAGRTAILKLLPLSLNELHSSYPIIDLESLMVRGTYPAVYDRGLSPYDWYPSYVETYLERDVRQLVKVGNLDKFTLFLKLLAGRAGKLLNLNTVCREAGVTQPTAKYWFSILIASQLLFILPPWYSNLNKRLLKTPKLYFTDTGLLCYLLGINAPETLKDNAPGGVIFENFIVSEFVKHQFVTPDKKTELFFYRDKQSREVDLIVDTGRVLSLFEIKYSHTVLKDHYRYLDYLSGLTDVRQSSVIYAGDQNLPRVTGWKKLVRIKEVLPH